MSLGRAPGVVVLGGINMDLVTYSDRFPGSQGKPLLASGS